MKFVFSSLFPNSLPSLSFYTPDTIITLPSPLLSPLSSPLSPLPSSFIYKTWGRCGRYGFIFVGVWVVIICYVTIQYTTLVTPRQHGTTPEVCTEEMNQYIKSKQEMKKIIAKNIQKRIKCEDPLVCDLRMHYLEELQEHRARVYEEHGITTHNPIRILFYTSSHYYQRAMDRWWFFRYAYGLYF